jgi:hypothetical protein
MIECTLRNQLHLFALSLTGMDDYAQEFCTIIVVFCACGVAISS